jgi:hypothetical protein
MGERILDPDEPLVKGHIVVFGCPNKKCKAPKFIESDDGKVRCQCGTQLINMNQNHLLKFQAITTRVRIRTFLKRFWIQIWNNRRVTDLRKILWRQRTL